MSFSFRPAVRENVGLLIGLIGGTGSGKSFTGMRLASGLSGEKPFAVIDTEARRALHYADQFRFDHAELKPPFRPSAYEDAIMAAAGAGYKVIMVDSMSHEHAGEGGLLDWHDEEVDRMAGNDYAKRERVNVAGWIKPKTAHKHMVQRLLQVNAHLILCFRAEEKIEMVKEGGKLVIVPKKSMTGINGWIPICEKSLPFELTASFLLTADAPGYPKPIKLQEQHRALFPLDKPITEESGRLIAQWASGGKAKESAAPASFPEHLSSAVVAGSEPGQADIGTNEALLIKGHEWAECGTDRYASWWTGLTKGQRASIGTTRHERMKEIAAAVPTGC